MNQSAEKRDDNAVPQYEAWPSVPPGPLPTHLRDTESTAMEVDNTNSTSGRASRDTSVLSMDDIEAAQALEGLRTGIAGLKVLSQSELNTAYRFPTEVFDWLFEHAVTYDQAYFPSAIFSPAARTFACPSHVPSSSPLNRYQRLHLCLYVL